MLNIEPEAPANDALEATRFDALFARFYPELFGLVYRVLGDQMQTEDTLQETFLKLSGEGVLQSRPEAEIGAWLRRVALNVAFNELRAARRTRGRLERIGRLELNNPDAPTDGPIGPAETFAREEECAAVRRALHEMPSRQRECLLLRHSGYSYAEIAATLGIAPGSVGVLLARAEHAFGINYRRQNPS